ncbi:MAG: ABC-type transport system involved in multi-copper enzyme maturation permease subunit [Planctomycetota bacterium]|jgi:ABC-type transport system involved in multi-copper enzyme maturation permease subunit
MNFTILRALFEDSRQQVLDNKVFRLLIILTGIPILFTFLVGFKEDHISLLWGFKEIPYKELIESFGPPGQDLVDMDITFIQGVQELFVSLFAGNFGMMLCIASTAFFAPRILEKGAADTLFSKPVGRMTVLLSRYVAGILFVAFISIVLVIGMYLGLWMVSGYNDPGFLWGALTLVYLYAMMHAFSICVAVFTRSSMAAIIMTIILFIICGAVHSAWMGFSYFKEGSVLTEILERADLEGEELETWVQTKEEEEAGALVKGLLKALDVAHYVLPKTSDSDLITAKLRRAILGSEAVVKTEDGDFVLQRGPIDFALVEESRDLLESSGLQWISESEGGSNDGIVTLRRYERPKSERTIGSKTRLRTLTSKDAASALVDELEALGEKPETSDDTIAGVRAVNVKWMPLSGATKSNRMFLTFYDYMYEMQFTLPVEVRESQASAPRAWEAGSLHKTEREEARWRRHFLGRGNLVLGELSGMDPFSWYQKVFDWNAELKYNIFFSIASSLLFILAMLGLSWWRLSRIDF